MRKLSATITCLLVLVLFGPGHTLDLLSAPESVIYDTLFERYLVSNWNTGAIVQIDSAGVQSPFAWGNCQAGLEIVDTVVYVGCSGLGVKGFSLYTGDPVAHVTIPGSILLNDVAADTSGNLYVSDPYGNKIYKIQLSDLSYSTLVDSIVWPNGLFYDRHNDRLLTCASTTRSIYTVDRDDGTLTFICQTEDGHLDGIAQDSAGNIYISAQGPDVVYRYDSAFSEPPEMVSRGHNYPADIFYNKRDNILAVPNIGGTTVDFIDFTLPELTACGLSVIESGEGSSDRLHPGETADIYPIICNSGYTATGLAATATSFNSFVTVVESEAAFLDDLARDEKISSSTPFRVSVLPGCPVPSVAVLGLQITADDGYVKEDSLLVFIGDTTGFFDDMEGNLGYWRHRSAKRLFQDAWRTDAECSYSGELGWRTGYSLGYLNLRCAELVSPPFLLPRHSSLTLWHRMEAQVGTEPGTAWDGGLVFLQTMDGEKVQITPDDGYTHTTLVSSTSPLRTETPVFSGDFDWTQAEFDLSAFSGVAQLIFCFVSDGAVTADGWCLDDVEVVLSQDVCCVDLTGNVDYDPEDLIDIADLVYLVDYMFNDGLAPQCTAEGNIDGLGDLDIGDLVYLVDYMFASGSEPPPCP